MKDARVDSQLVKTKKENCVIVEYPNTKTIKTIKLLVKYSNMYDLNYLLKQKENSQEETKFFQEVEILLNKKTCKLRDKLKIRAKIE